MAFKMKGFKGPFKQVNKKTYPKGYIKEDIKFLYLKKIVNLAV